MSTRSETPLPTVVERVGETAVEGVEFAGINGHSVESLGWALESAGLEVAAAHVGLDQLEDGLVETLEPYVELGCEDIVVPWLDPVEFESRDRLEAVGNRLSTVADDLASRGLSLHYHNHSQEFVDLDLAATVTAVEDRGVDWLIYEAEGHPDSYVTLNHADEAFDSR